MPNAASCIPTTFGFTIHSSLTQSYSVRETMTDECVGRLHNPIEYEVRRSRYPSDAECLSLSLSLSRILSLLPKSLGTPLTLRSP